MEMKTDTPRTDEQSFPDFERGGDVVLADFARELERELAASKLASRLLLDSFAEFGGGASMMHPRLTRAISDARKSLVTPARPA